MRKIAAAFLLILISSLVAYAQEKAPNGVREERGIVYKTADGQDLKLNLFLPTYDGVPGDKVPLLIWLDSGCWYSNGPGNGGYWSTLKALEKGFAVASVGHRSLSGPFVFPAQIEDVRHAVQFLRSRAKEYGLDPDRFAASGASSGGHLSSTLGLSDKNFVFDRKDIPCSGQVNAVIEFYGPAACDRWIADPPYVIPDCMYQALGAKKTDGKPLAEQADALADAAKKYAPRNYIDADFAPTFVLHGVMDKTVPVSQGVLFYETLKKAGVRTRLYISNTGVHDINSLGTPEELGPMIFDFLGWKP